jgi:AMP nucleosidase
MQSPPEPLPGRATPGRPPQLHHDAESALADVRERYEASLALLRDRMRRFLAGERLDGHVRACYPRVAVVVETVARAETPLAYGFVAGPGRYETTLTRPDLFGHYHQIGRAAGRDSVS